MAIRRAEPFYFGAAARPIFGWYHAPEGRCRDGVVLASSLGLEGTRSHWSYRHLAERLASAGLGVLRFDWGGTGDSGGDDHEPERVKTWVSDLNLAIDELKRLSGAVRPTVVGVRVAATLAGHVAAQRDDIGALVLWMPALNGAAWVTEMAKLHKLYLRIVPQAHAPEPDGEELLGSFASNATIADLAGIDLLAMGRRPAPRILVIDQSPARAVDQLRERLAAVDAQAEWRRGSGQKFLLTVPHKTTLPEESLSAIVDWVTAAPAGVDDVTARAGPGRDALRRAGGSFRGRTSESSESSSPPPNRPLPSVRPSSSSPRAR